MGMRGLPANQGATVGQARPEGDEQGKIAGFDPTGASSLVNREGNGGGRGVTVAFEIDEKAVHREFEKLGDGVDDAEIGTAGNRGRENTVMTVELVEGGHV